MLANIDGAQIVAILLVLGIVTMFVYFQRSQDSSYDFLDTLKDSAGKTSIGAHFAWAFFVLAVWLILTHAAKDPGETFSWIRDCLLISLGYRVATSGVAAFAKRPMAAPSQGDNIAQQVLVAPTDVPVVASSAKPPPAVKVPQ